MKVFITGGSGLIGGALVEALRQRGDQPLVLSRNATDAAEKLGDDVLVVEGDPTAYGDWASQLDGCDAVVNLAGEPIFGRRWNDRQKQRLRQSRVEATRNVARAIREATSPPGTLISGSAIGFYGNVPEGEVTESSAPGDDFLAKTCAAWEAEALAAGEAGPLRVAIIRIGVVLAREGGALRQMLTPFKMGLGGPVGFGRQWVSWIHLEDLVRVFLFALDIPEARGPINATGPEPLPNKAFSKSLAKALGRPCLFPIPPLMLRLVFGPVSEVVTTGQRVVPRQLLDLGFSFRFATCQDAMNDLFRA